jgi:hypothetical protein
VISFTVGGAITCADVSSLVSAFVNGGNSFGAAATLLEYGKMVSVVVAAVKELYQQVRGIHADDTQRDQKISALEIENHATKEENVAIKSRLEAIEKKLQAE